MFSLAAALDPSITDWKEPIISFTGSALMPKHTTHSDEDEDDDEYVYNDNNDNNDNNDSGYGNDDNDNDNDDNDDDLLILLYREVVSSVFFH